MRIAIMVMLYLAVIPSKIDASAGDAPSVEEYFGIPRGLLRAMCKVESGDRTYVVHKNDGGSDSLGWCQIKLSTARLVGFRGTKKQLMIPKVNYYYAAKYLSRQIKRYHKDYAKAVTSYNQGTCYGHGGGAYLAKVFTAWGEEIHQ